MSDTRNVYGDLGDETRGVRMQSIADADSGAQLLGGTVYELEPGARWASLHLHYANEELLIVVDGTPTLHTLDGERELASGDVVSFPRGRRGAHRVENQSDVRARFVIVSTMTMPDVVEYPELGEVFVMTEPPHGEGLNDPDEHGRLVRVFERGRGRPIPPDA
jgi:uncharacterized cupin superfamily protein